MPLDLLITGRIATLAGESGFGWVEAIGIRDGRVAFAGSEVALETRADPFTERIALEPDEVAVPGLTDAHLHLAGAALSKAHIDLSDTTSLADGLALVRAAHERVEDPDAWLLGHGWDLDRWGRWPTAADLEAVAPGRRCVLWAHDHHALWVSRATLTTCGLDRSTPDPGGGVIRRDAAGDPEGVLLEEAAGLVAEHVPGPTSEELERVIAVTARELLALGLVGAHDPGLPADDPDLGLSFAAYARLAERDALPIRVIASLHADALATALAGGLRSGDILGAKPEGRARVGWLKLFADGTLGSRTAALLSDIEPEPERPLPPEHRRGVWSTPVATLGELADLAAGGGIATQIHAIGDAAVRGALDVLAPTVGRTAFMPRIEHAQLVDPADRDRFTALGVAASVQPIHLGSDATKARLLWGSRAEVSGYAWRSLVATGAVVAFGTDAPVEPWDPWPGIALAVCRADPRWAKGTPAFGPGESLTVDRALRAACIGGPQSAGEPDRGRLTVGQRADLAVIPAACVDDPVEPGGALWSARPSVVVMDGRVVFEA